MSLPHTSLIDAQNALSHLHFAVSQEVEGIGNYGVDIGYHPYPGFGLYLEIEVKAKDSQELADRLNHGALSGEYDYRFTCGRELSDDPERYVKVTAYPRMFDHTEPLAASPTPSNDTLQGRGEVDWTAKAAARMASIAAIPDAVIDAALNATVPGGSSVSAWLPQKDAWTPHETARDVIRHAIHAALAALQKDTGNDG